MKLSRQDKISYLQPDWGRDLKVSAGFTTRNGGVSRAPYNSLNLGFNTDDQQYNVEGNRSNLSRAFGISPYQLLTVKQVHGTDLLIIDEANPDLSHFLDIECDAIITNQPGIMIGILVADCYPVILFDPVQGVAAAVHVGWRGAAGGILGRTLKALQVNFNSMIHNIQAAVGPGIGGHFYEVDRPVREAFRKGAGQWDLCSREVGLGKWQLDLKQACLLQLVEAGLTEMQIDAADECTCCHKELFYSYRRDSGKTGRQLGFIMLG
jgi:purine-nucleoside/S-methyl-5'-thioadenosine phosphorylase / adenosine deaminase